MCRKVWIVGTVAPECLISDARIKNWQWNGKRYKGKGIKRRTGCPDIKRRLVKLQVIVAQLAVRSNEAISNDSWCVIRKVCEFPLDMILKRFEDAMDIRKSAPLRC